MKKKIDPQRVEARDVYSILSSAIAPRPIAFVSTVDKNGKVNLSPFSFFNVFGANPPTLVFSPVRSMRTLENKHTLQNIEEVKEVHGLGVDFFDVAFRSNLRNVELIVQDLEKKRS